MHAKKKYLFQKNNHCHITAILPLHYYDTNVM